MLGAAAACAAAGPEAAAEAEATDMAALFPADKKLQPAWVESLTARGTRKVYAGKELATIAMPCGGIAAGQLYVRGDGTLAQWWISNNYQFTGYGDKCYRTYRPESPLDQGFAVRVKPEGGNAVVRRLSQDDFDAIEFVGEYPIAEVRYKAKEKPALGVEVTAEVFSPFIPLVARDSGLPVTVLRFAVRNTAQKAADVTLAGWLQNGVMLSAAGNPELLGRNRVVRGEGRTSVQMDVVVPPSARSGDPRQHPGFGDMAITALDAQAGVGAAYESADKLLADLAGDARLAAGEEKPFPPGAKRLGAVASAMHLAPGQEKQVTFLVTWYFPNRPNVGNMYANWFKDSVGVADYVARNFDRLSGDTHLFRDTYFDTTLPYWLAARLAMPASILATETCQWWKNGRFYAWEGVGCCEGTCTHVWNYEHACARLFPELSRSTRLMQDLGAGFDAATGLVGFRGNRAYAADGQCGTVLKVYREHLMSADRKFLEEAWPKAKKAIEFLIGHDGQGIIEDTQHNTYDINFYGPNTFVGSLYLAALRAAQEMATLAGDGDAAARYKGIREKGAAYTVEKQWNGEYFIQLIPAGRPDRDQYGMGCLADQLFGQGWAEQLGLGPVYPRDKVRAALAAVYRYNWVSDVGPYNRRFPPERWFARPGEAGLFVCTWPKGRRQADPVRYRDEVWTGAEYQVAGHMLYEGMVQEALAIIRGVHDRYDGAHHNPWNEVECGDHYARAMASWGCLLGAEGYVYDGPAGKIGFAPRLTPHDFKAFFTAAQGWGSLVQRRGAGAQINRIDVKFGNLSARTLVFDLPAGGRATKAAVTVAGRAVPAEIKQEASRITLALAEPATINRGEALEVAITLA